MGWQSRTNQESNNIQLTSDTACRLAGYSVATNTHTHVYTLYVISGKGVPTHTANKTLLNWLARDIAGWAAPRSAAQRPETVIYLTPTNQNYGS